MGFKETTKGCRRVSGGPGEEGTPGEIWSRWRQPPGIKEDPPKGCVVSSGEAWGSGACSEGEAPKDLGGVSRRMGVPEPVAGREEERSAGKGDPRSRSEGGAESARAETKRQRAGERQSGRSGDTGRRAGGPTQGRKRGRTDGRTDGKTGQGRAGRGRRPSPRGAAAAPGGAGRAPGVRAEEATAATTWVGQTDGVTDGLAAAAASGGHSPSSLTRPGPRLRFCTPERRGLRVKAPRRPRPSRQPRARAPPGIPGPPGGARRRGSCAGAHASRAAHALARRPPKGSARPRRLAHARAGGAPPSRTAPPNRFQLERHARSVQQAERPGVRAGHPGGDALLWVGKLRRRRKPTVGFSSCTQVLATQQPRSFWLPLLPSPDALPRILRMSSVSHLCDLSVPVILCKM